MPICSKRVAPATVERRYICWPITGCWLQLGPLVQSIQLASWSPMLQATVVIAYEEIAPTEPDLLIVMPTSLTITSGPIVGGGGGADATTGCAGSNVGEPINVSRPRGRDGSRRSSSPRRV